MPILLYGDARAIFRRVTSTWHTAEWVSELPDARSGFFKVICTST